MVQYVHHQYALDKVIQEERCVLMLLDFQYTQLRKLPLLKHHLQVQEEGEVEEEVQNMKQSLVLIKTR